MAFGVTKHVIYTKEPNKKDTWLIVIKKTGEVLEGFRNKTTAKNFLPKWKKIEEREIDLIENLED